MVPVFINVWERFTTKNYRPVSLLSVVNKVFEKLFLIFSMVLGLLDLLTVVSDRSAGAFNRSGATRAAVLDVSKATAFGFGILVLAFCS